MGALTVIIMIVAFIGMIVCAKIQKTNPNAKVLAILCLIIVFGCAIKFMVDQGAFGGDTREVTLQKESYARFNESAAKALGEFIGKKYANEKIFIVAPGGNDWAKSKNDNPTPDLLQKYIGGSNVEIGGLPYTPNPEMGPMMEESSSAKYFNQLFKEKPDVKLFVFTINLPFDPAETGRLSIWNQSKGPKIALFNADVHYLAAEIKKGIVAAAVVLRPDLKQEDYEKLSPKNLEDAFKARYLLVTPENVEQMAKQYSNIFSTGRR